ncbi:MAG: hypothetical protein J6C46_04275 [Clostridia bacterium]|nr:hypothetical protein [Clostridia bacterium]
MTTCNHIPLMNFQEARRFSELAKNKYKKFKPFILSLHERELLVKLTKMEHSSLSQQDIITYQKLYCKKQLFYAINIGIYHVNLKFNSPIQQEVKDWINSHGYYLAPMDVNCKEKDWFDEFIFAEEKSTKEFDLRW